MLKHRFYRGPHQLCIYYMMDKLFCNTQVRTRIPVNLIIMSLSTETQVETCKYLLFNLHKQDSITGMLFMSVIFYHPSH